MTLIYKKSNAKKLKNLLKYGGLLISIFSIFFLIYILLPLISWKFYFEPVFASNTVEVPIPKTNVLSKDTIQTLFAQAVDNINVDYTDAKNWFPKLSSAYEIKPDPGIITMFNISIPKLGIQYANVSTIDTDLSKHLILYPGTAIPPNLGNAVIFGHSTIPNLFNPLNYETIFATVHKLKEGDQIYATVNTREYMYIVESIRITTPDDMDIFTQDSNESYLTILTCTPPGTTWKRLVIKARLDK